MTQISRTVTEHVLALLAGDKGMNAALDELKTISSHVPADIRSFLGMNVAAELLEKANQAQYPAVLVYCEKLNNTLEEKFRTFSGQARVTVEIRNSEDRIEGVNKSSSVYADVICEVLNQARGPWSDAFWFGGGYEVTYQPVKAGGKHFVQSTKVTFEVDVSV
jgi:hypothetical protein